MAHTFCDMVLVEIPFIYMFIKVEKFKVCFFLYNIHLMYNTGYFMKKVLLATWALWDR